MRQLCFHEESIYEISKILGCTVHKIWHASDFVRNFSKGHNSRKGDNSDKEKKTCAKIFYHKEFIYEISKP